MFLLTHAAAAEAVLSTKLSPTQKDQLLLGSILPDVAELKWADEKRTHTEGLQFLRSIGKDHHYLSVGVILHGSSPKGLDYYTHNGFYNIGNRYASLPPQLHADSGIIAKKYAEIAPLLRQYRKSLGNLHHHDAAHFIVEFCFDHLTAQKDAGLSERLRKAMSNSVSNHSLPLFAQYFKVNEKHYKRLKKILLSNQWNKIFNRFQTSEGTAHNLQHFLFVKSLREQQHKEHKLHFLHVLRQFGRSSLGLLQTKLRDKSLIRLIEQCTVIIQKDYASFMDHAVKNIKVVARKEKLT